VSLGVPVANREEWYIHGFQGVTSNGVKVRVYTPLGKKEQGKFALEVSLKTLPFYDQYFGIPYPLPKVPAATCVRRSDVVLTRAADGPAGHSGLCRRCDGELGLRYLPRDRSRMLSLSLSLFLMWCI
jgi:aminopeptidase N